jgi:hypothetical protein
MGLCMKNKSLTASYCALALMALSPGANGEVLDAAANGFTVKHSIVIEAGRSEVYGSVVDDISQWWSSDHTISGDAGNLFISAQPNGCFCERLGPNAGLVHMAVTFVNPGVMLRFTGGLGPLGLMGVNGNMTWEFEEHEKGTLVTVNYAVGGYLDGGLDALASPVDGVLVEQFERLKRLVETGQNQNAPKTQ